MTVMAASDENECRQMLYTALQQPGPDGRALSARRRHGCRHGQADDRLPLGKGEIRRESSQKLGSGKRIAILAFGTMVAPSLVAAEELDATVANMRFVKPLDADLLRELAETHDAHRDRRGRRDHGRRGFGVRRIAAGEFGDQAGAATWPARSVHRSRRPGQAARQRRAGWRGHRHGRSANAFSPRSKASPVKLTKRVA